ncbi:hypothetical protein NFX52_18420, partial [Acidovorax facilis]
GNRASRPCERPKWAAQEATKSKKWRLPRSRGKFRGLVQRSLKLKRDWYADSSRQELIADMQKKAA